MVLQGAEDGFGAYRELAVEELGKLSDEDWEVIRAPFLSEQVPETGVRSTGLVEAASGELSSFKEAYLDLMRDSGTWAGNPELAALARGLHRHFRIRSGEVWLQVGDEGEPIYLELERYHYTHPFDRGASPRAEPGGGRRRRPAVLSPCRLERTPPPDPLPEGLGEDIRETIRNLRPGVSAGPDGVPGDLLKTDPKAWSSFLMAILQRVVRTGEFPPSLLESRVVPIHIQGEQGGGQKRKARPGRPREVPSHWDWANRLHRPREGCQREAKTRGRKVHQSRAKRLYQRPLHNGQSSDLSCHQTGSRLQVRPPAGHSEGVRHGRQAPPPWEAQTSEAEPAAGREEGPGLGLCLHQRRVQGDLQGHCPPSLALAPPVQLK